MEEAILSIISAEIMLKNISSILFVDLLKTFETIKLQFEKVWLFNWSFYSVQVYASNKLCAGQPSYYVFKLHGFKVIFYVC